MFQFIFIFFAHGVYYQVYLSSSHSLSFSFSLLPPHYGMRLRFYREKVFSPHRLAWNCAYPRCYININRRSQQLIPFVYYFFKYTQ